MLISLVDGFRDALKQDETDILDVTLDDLTNAMSSINQSGHKRRGYKVRLDGKIVTAAANRVACVLGRRNRRCREALISTSNKKIRTRPYAHERNCQIVSSGSLGAFYSAD